MVRQDTDHVKDAEETIETTLQVTCKLANRTYPGYAYANGDYSVEEVGTKVRVDNVHYDLSEEDLLVRPQYRHS